jgi:hypothetical protein
MNYYDDDDDDDDDDDNHNHIITFFTTSLSAFQDNYSLLFYIPILAIFYKNKNYAFLAIISIIFLGVIGLIPIYYNIYNAIGMSYLSLGTVEIVQNLTLSTVVYPVANFIVIVMLYNSLKNKG